MGLLTFIQIPYHHVLANEIALNLKYHIGLKHLFKINLGIAIIKKTIFFVCIFDIYPRVFTQISTGRACWMRNLILHPTSTHLAYFWWTLLPQNNKYLKKCDDDAIITFFQVFLVFGVAGSVKSMPSGYSLDAEFNSASNELSRSKFLTRGYMSKIQTKN